MTVEIGAGLSLADVVAVARGAPVAFPELARASVAAARAVVERGLARATTIYGVTTGFGRWPTPGSMPSQAAELQHGIVRSHATAVGRPLSREEARAMLLLRAHVLALGYSGVRGRCRRPHGRDAEPRADPVVPEQGSLGASGDLAPLANLALPLIGQGGLAPGGRQRAGGRGARARRACRRSCLEAKEGLALVNGTQGMLAVGILAADRVPTLARAADVAAAMTIEAALGTDAAFDERLQRLRPHPGQVASGVEPAPVAGRLADPGVASREPAPGAGRLLAAVRAAGARGHPRRARLRRRRAARSRPDPSRDNPIVLRRRATRSAPGGNFHGQPVAVALDTLAHLARSGWRRSANAASTGCWIPSRTTTSPRSWCTAAG